MTTTTTVYKLKKLTHAQIVATAKVVVYRKAMLEKSQDVDKKVQFAIADRFYKNTVRPAIIAVIKLIKYMI